MTDQEYRELRKEYTKYRDIFQKRVKRSSAAGYKQAKPYLKGEYAYQPTLKEMQNLPYIKKYGKDVQYRDLQMRVKELKRLVTEGVASIFRQRAIVRERDQAVLGALSKAGYSHITRSTLVSFGRFMDRMRDQYGKKLPNSEEMVEFFDSLKYNTKRKSTEFLVQLWEDYQKNGYEPDNGSQDLFAT